MILINCDFINYKSLVVDKGMKSFFVGIKKIYDKIIIIIIINIYIQLYTVNTAKIIYIK